MKNLLTKLANHFGLYTKSQLQPKTDNIVIQYQNPKILHFKADIRPTYQQMIQLPLNTQESLKTALIMACKKKLFDELQKQIIIEEVVDNQGTKITAKLNVVTNE